MHIDDRFEPETIADHENHAPTKVTDRDGEHAAEPLQEVDSPMFVCMQNELGIGTSTEMKPFVPQHGALLAHSAAVHPDPQGQLREGGDQRRELGRVRERGAVQQGFHARLFQ